jgi:hypothetical protein
MQFCHAISPTDEAMQFCHMILPHNFVQILQHDSAYNRKNLLALITFGKTTQAETFLFVL